MSNKPMTTYAVVPTAYLRFVPSVDVECRGSSMRVRNKDNYVTDRCHTQDLWITIRIEYIMGTCNFFYKQVLSGEIHY